MIEIYYTSCTCFITNVNIPFFQISVYYFCRSPNLSLYPKIIISTTFYFAISDCCIHLYIANSVENEILQEMILASQSYFPFLFRNIPATLACEVYIAKLIRYKEAFKASVLCCAVKIFRSKSSGRHSELDDPFGYFYKMTRICL